MTPRTVEPWHQSPWDWRAAIQFICGGTGSGLIAFTALAALSDPAWLWRTGLAGAGIVCLGLLSVFIKLGRRWRAFLVIMNPFTSWLTREALLAPVLIGLMLLAVLLADRIVAAAAGLAGLGFLYAQARMLKEARGIPAWRNDWMLRLVIATGLAEGLSLLALAAAYFGSPGPWLAWSLAGIILLRLMVWLIYRYTLTRSGAAPIRTGEVLQAMQWPLVLAGHVLPLTLLLLSRFFPDPRWLLALAGCAACLSGWYLKFMLVTRAAYTQGFGLVRTPARTPGYSGPGVKPGWTSPD